MNTAYAQLEAEHQISSHPVAFPLISCRQVSATPAKRDDWPPDRPEARSSQLLPAVVYVGLFGRRNLALGLIRQISCAFKSQRGTGCTFDTQDRCGSRLRSQRTQVLGHRRIFESAWRRRTRRSPDRRFD
jgi:hypothetical protein